MNENVNDVEIAAKAFAISSRVLRDNGIIVILSPEDLRKFGKTVATWSIIGGVSLGLLGWGIHRTEEDRKWRREMKAQKKQQKVAQKIREQR